MSSPASDLLDSLPAELSQQLKEHVNRVLLDFIRPNSASQFAQNSPVLAKFREAIAQGDSKDDVEFLHNFTALVPITSYEPYQPFVAKFSATPCREADVKDMFSPGLPCFLAMTSSAFGKEPKLFARYRPPPQCVRDPIYLAIPSSEGTIFAPSSLRYLKVLRIDHEDGQSSHEVVVCSASSGILRMQMNWDVEHDMDRLDLWVPGQTAPFVISIVEGYRPFFILHALFVLADPRVTIMCFVFANVFATLVQFIEDEWLLLVDCIENGIIPNLENIHLVRGVLEKHFAANPVRAAELREIGPPGAADGWAVRVWPALTTFIGITGDSATAALPRVWAYQVREAY
ncbi:hypothetical protein AZE42_01924 [Rhizopogon vesiculosus]|uniref:Uncharacterized protein n=1 Tax=Rhizopogon vesiculosus TaxID=180088 RepID=A0A1J8QNG1_9AGAM|nr:hypothetical protein AZE42_01924 [Rhizopogon vesiculosus]